jgi:hypothetical protein
MWSRHETRHLHMARLVISQVGAKDISHLSGTALVA